MNRNLLGLHCSRPLYPYLLSLPNRWIAYNPLDIHLHYTPQYRCFLYVKKVHFISYNYEWPPPHVAQALSQACVTEA